MEEIQIHTIPGFFFGQAQDPEAGTGCTVIVCPQGAVTGADVRGGSPGTRDTDALDPRCNREAVHAVLLTGGSAFGLDAAGGVMKCLEQHRIGRDVMVTVVPNVCGAVLFDLKCGRGDIRPDEIMGRAACESALKGLPFQCGNFGAGTGCTVGKILGREHAMKSGIGAFACRQGDLLVGAVAAVNCTGDVVDHGTILAGARSPSGTGFADTERVLLDDYASQKDVFSGNSSSGENTVIGCVVTNAALNKGQVNKLAAIAQNGLARAVRPAHATFDGDTMFAMSCGDVRANPDAVGVLAALAVENAILTAVRRAEPLFGFPSVGSLQK